MPLPSRLWWTPPLLSRLTCLIVSPCPVPQLRWAEIPSGLCALWWTFLLLAPVELFETNASFLGLGQVAQEHTWAAFTGGVGIWTLASSLTGRPWPRIIAACGGMFLWSFVAFRIADSSPHWHGLPVNTGFGIYSIVSGVRFSCLLVLSRLVVNPVVESVMDSVMDLKRH